MEMNLSSCKVWSKSVGNQVTILCQRLDLDSMISDSGDQGPHNCLLEKSESVPVCLKDMSKIWSTGINRDCFQTPTIFKCSQVLKYSPLVFPVELSRIAWRLHAVWMHTSLLKTPQHGHRSLKICVFFRLPWYRVHLVGGLNPSEKY